MVKILELSDVTMGTDPEFPMIDGDGFLVPPVVLRKQFGLKVTSWDDPNHPVFTEDKRNGVTVMEDGALFELTVKPSINPDDIFRRVQTGLLHLKRIGKEFGLTPLHKPVAKFDFNKYYLDTTDEEVKKCVIAGCDPDKDAIDSAFKSKIADLTLWKYRGAGGHLHLGVPNMPDLHQNIIPAVQLLAITVGNVGTAYTNYVEEEKARMQVFGFPGRYRPQNYGEVLGIEYRALSNSWLVDKSTVNLVHKASMKALELLANPTKGKEVLRKYLDVTVEAIKGVDKDASLNILSDLKLIV